MRNSSYREMQGSGQVQVGKDYVDVPQKITRRSPGEHLGRADRKELPTTGLLLPDTQAGPLPKPLPQRVSWCQDQGLLALEAQKSITQKGKLERKTQTARNRGST